MSQFFKGRRLHSDEHPDMVVLRTGLPVKGFIMGLRKQDDGSTIWIEIESTPIFSRDTSQQSPSGALTLFFEIPPPDKELSYKQKTSLNKKNQESLVNVLMSGEANDAQQLKIRTSLVATFMMNMCSLTFLKNISKSGRTILGFEVFLVVMQLHSINPLKRIPLKHIIHSSQFSGRRVLDFLHKMDDQGLINIERMDKDGQPSRESYIYVNPELHRIFIGIVLELTEIISKPQQLSPNRQQLTLDWDKLMSKKKGG